MTKLKILFSLIFLFSAHLKAQVYYFEVRFTDKNNSLFNTNNPQEFLSEKAISRRLKQKIPVSVEDLPINLAYLDSVNVYSTIKAQSKWLNLVAIALTDTSINLNKIRSFPFVSSLKYIGMDVNGTGKKLHSKFDLENQLETIDYSNSSTGIKQLNGDYLHEKNYLGQNMTIAILDAGFPNVNNMDCFKALFENGKILSSKNFVHPDESVYSSHNHGTMVLSVLAGNESAVVFGSATEANYLLLLTEDVSQENLIEEYWWLNAAEYADSVGADLINSSLGYYEFDSPEFNHKYSDFYQNNTIISKAANKAFEKGILVFNSAGNEGNTSWKYLVFPADENNVIAVGGITENKEHSFFSSLGYDFPNMVKPNVSAFASGVFVKTSNTNNENVNGTSFSSPLLCGLGACLWQAFPEKSNREIKSIIEQSAHIYNNPNDKLGYGIPDFKKAFLSNYNNIEISNDQFFVVYPNPISDDNLYLYFRNDSINFTQADIFDLNGNFVFHHQINSENKISENGFEINGIKLSQGLYFLRIKLNGENWYSKIMVEN